jgi:hypothetical protein
MNAPWHVPGQISLLDDPIEAQFIAFHHANPEVYDTLLVLAERWQRAGHLKVGIGMLFEIVRWERGLHLDEYDGEQFRLNNNYRSRYARLLMANNPHLAGFFETRALAGEASWM